LGLSHLTALQTLVEKKQNKTKQNKTNKQTKTKTKNKNKTKTVLCSSFSLTPTFFSRFVGLFTLWKGIKKLTKMCQRRVYRRFEE